MNSEKVVTILTDLSNCIDPDTGEIFDKSILTQYSVLEATIAFASRLMVLANEKVSNTNWPSDEIYEKLRAWRNDEAVLREIKPFQVLWNETLRLIAEEPILHKENLRNIQGIGQYKYEEYGDLIFEILKPYIDAYNENQKAAIVDSNCTITIADNMVPVAEEIQVVDVKLTCKNCMLLRSDNCFGNGDPENCEDFRFAPDFDETETAHMQTLRLEADRLRFNNYRHR